MIVMNIGEFIFEIKEKLGIVSIILCLIIVVNSIIGDVRFQHRYSFAKIRI